MAEFDNNVSVSVSGLEEPVRLINAAADRVAGTIQENRKLVWLVVLLTFINLTTVFFTEWADNHSFEIIVATVVLFLLHLLLGRRKSVKKEN